MTTQITLPENLELIANDGEVLLVPSSEFQQESIQDDYGQSIGVRLIAELEDYDTVAFDITQKSTETGFENHGQTVESDDIDTSDLNLSSKTIAQIDLKLPNSY